MNQKENALQNDFSLLLNFLADKCTFPKYDSVKFILEECITLSSDNVPEFLESSLKSLTDFSEKYEEIKGKRLGWINIQAAGVYKNVLICIVEYPKRESFGGLISVNFSGPFRSRVTGEFEWDITHHYRIIESK